MLLTFYVHSKPKSSSFANEDESFLEAIYHRMGNLSQLSWDEIATLTRDSFDNARQRAKVLFLYLTGQPDASTSGSTARAGPGVGKTTDIGKPVPEAEKPSVWSFAGLFSGLKGKKSSSSSKANSNSFWDTKWDEGEVHAHLVRVRSLPYVLHFFPTNYFIGEVRR